MCLSHQASPRSITSLSSTQASALALGLLPLPSQYQPVTYTAAVSKRLRKARHCFQRPSVSTRISVARYSPKRVSRS